MADTSNLVTSVQLTPDEATYGCTKEIFVEGMLSPVIVRFPAGTTNGRAVTVQNVACIDTNGTVCNKTLYIAVWAQGVKPKRRTNIKSIIAATLVVICIALAFGFLRDSDVLDTRFYRGPELIAGDVIPNLSQRYYLNSLDGPELQAACIVYQTVLDFKGQCTLPHGVTTEEFEMLLLLLRAECPEILQLDFSNDIRYYYDVESNQVYSAYFQYDIDRAEYRTQLDACEEVVNSLCDETADMTDAEKEKYIFDYLSMHTYYDDEAANAGNAYGAFIEGKAKCDGISLAMKWCMEEAGVSCLCILADPKEGAIGHAWNMVCLDGQYYNVDLTGSMRYYDEETTPYKDEIIYVMYNASDRWHEDEYIICDAFNYWIAKPICNTDLQSYYAQINRLYPATSNAAGIANSVMNTSYKTKQSVSFQVMSDEIFMLLQEDMEKIAKKWLLLNHPNERLTVEWAFFENNVVWLIAR